MNSLQFTCLNQFYLDPFKCRPFAMRFESHVKIWSHIPLPRPIVKAFKHSNMSGESVRPFVNRDDSQLMPRLRNEKRNRKNNESNRKSN